MTLTRRGNRFCGNRFCPNCKYRLVPMDEPHQFICPSCRKVWRIADIIADAVAEASGAVDAIQQQESNQR